MRRRRRRRRPIHVRAREQAHNQQASPQGARQTVASTSITTGHEPGPIRRWLVRLWKLAVGIFALIGFLLSVYPFVRPDIVLEVDNNIPYNADPFHVYFRLTNEGYFPVFDIRMQCDLIKVELLDPQTSTTAPIPWLQSRDSTTETCFGDALQFELQRKIEDDNVQLNPGAELFVAVSFRTWGFRRQLYQQWLFVTVLDAQGEIRWLQRRSFGPISMSALQRRRREYSRGSPSP